MKLEQRQRELRLTDRVLAERAGVSTATLHRAKRGGASRFGPMEQIAAALECEVRDIDEFHSALRERVIREARRQGAPDEALDEAEHLFEVGAPPDRETMQLGAYTMLTDAIAYLERTGRADLVDRAIRERKQAR
jgi:DNA-binding Xre family transcriptional regulator